MENGNTQILAEKIAQLLQTDAKSADYNSIQSNLEKINQRLDHIESQIASQNHTSQILNPQKYHSSREKFNGLEELADEMISGLQTEKACPYEPTGKPCDHCAMCNSRGF